MAVENRNLMATVLLVLASAAYNTGSGPAANPASSSGTANPGATSHKNDLTPWKTLTDFGHERDDRKLKFLIATIPDPVDTHLAIFFDRGIESVENAASTAGYDFDRYWIPWRENPYAATADPAIRDKQEKEKKVRELQPGLLLFRGPSDMRDLAIFLVGETPTSGIQAEQFTAAINFIRQVEQREGAPRQPIPISGTTFSGSLPSLAAAIRMAQAADKVAGKAPGKIRKFQIVSGSTTSQAAEKEFRRTVGSSEFHSTLHPDDVALAAFLSKVSEEHDRSDQDEKLKIAILSEGDTAFGDGIRGSTISGLKWAEIRSGRMQKENFLDALDDTDIEIFNFPFPRDIARLRNAYHEDSFSSPLPDKYKSLTPEGVPLTLKDPNTGHDSVPSFSREHTPVSQDATLQSLAVALRRNEVRYVGIAATDPLDTFFLARFLATSAPDIRIFQLDADLMFIRPPDSLPLDGMLSITTYPLFAQNQYWTNPKQGWRVFSSKYSQGVYNATLSLLRDGDSPNQALLEYNSPFNDSPGGPPLWLTAAGRNGYWPVQLLPAKPTDILAGADTRDSDLAKETNWAEPKIEEPPHIFTGSIWLVSALLLWAGVGLCCANFARFKQCSAIWCSEFRLWGRNPPLRGPVRRAPYILLCVLSLTAIFLCLAGPQYRLLEFGREVEERLPFAITAAALVLAAAFLAVPLIRRLSLVTGLGLAGFIAFVWIGSKLLYRDGNHEDFFLAYRSINLSSGLAPNLPLILLFIAFFAWGRVHLQRRILLEERHQSMPLIPLPHQNPRGYLCETAAHRVQESLTLLTLPAWLASVFGAAGVCFVSFPHLQILEPRPYLYLCCGGVTVLFFLVNLTAAQFLTIWMRMERLLDEMASHPIRFALSDLPQDRAWSPIWQSNVRKRSHVLLTRGVDCVQALQHGPHRTPHAMPQLTQCTNLLLQQVALGKNEAVEQARATTISNGIAWALANQLSKDYWLRGSAESPSLKLPDNSKPNTDKHHRLAAEFVALRVLAYIRYIMLHLRNLLGFLTTGFMLALLSLQSYPFQAPHIIMATTLTLFALISGATIWMFYRMNTNLILRSIMDSDDGKGKNEWGRWLQLAETGALPLLAVISSNVPGAGRFLFSWLGPVLDKLH